MAVLVEGRPPGGLTMFLACPAEDAIQHSPVQLAEGDLGIDVLIVGAPAASNLVELFELVPGGLVGRVPPCQRLDLGFETLDALLTGVNEHNRLAVGSPLPSDVEAQEGEAFIDMGNARLFLAELKLEMLFQKRLGLGFQGDGAVFRAVPELDPVVGVADENRIPQPSSSPLPSLVASETAVGTPPPQVELVQVDVSPSKVTPIVKTTKWEK